MDALGTLTAATFEPLRGDRFRMLAADGRAFDIELVDVTEAAQPGQSRNQFSLVFRGGPDPPLPQRIYRVEHDDLGPIEIFLVPIAADRYEAVFT